MIQETRDHRLAEAIEETIPVPALAPDFWHNLARIDPVEPVDVPGRERKTRVWHQRSRVLIAAVALAAVAAAAVVAGLAMGVFDGSKPSVSAAVASGEVCCAPGETRLEWYHRYLKSHPEMAAQVAKRQKTWEREASRLAPNSTGVRTLLAYRQVDHAVGASNLPASVSEEIQNNEMFATGGETYSAIQEPVVGNPATGEPSIYLVTYPDNLCMLIVLRGAAGSCFVALRQAAGSLSAEDSIFDGKRFVHGLVADDVTAITVSAAGSSTTAAASVAATIENNAFIAPLPYDGGFGLGAVTITLTRSDGSIATVEIPALNAPAPHGPTTHP